MADESVEQTPPGPDERELFQTDISVGEIFRRTRIHYGRSIQDIERALRIRANQIEAIEADDIEKLPGRVYAIGFIRSYAEYLGLNGDKMVGLFKSQLGGKAPKPALHFPVSAADSKLPPVWMVMVSLGAAVLILAGWWGFNTRDRSALMEIEPVPTLENTGPVMAENGPDMEEAGIVEGEAAAAEIQGAAVEDIAMEEPAPPPEPEVKGIILNIEQSSWVEIRDESGKAIVSRVLNEGDRYFVPEDRPDLKMSLGNAGGVLIEVDGMELTPLGKVGEVKRNVPLDINYLKEQYSKEEENEDGESEIQ